MIVVPFLPAHLKDLIVHDYMGFIQDDLDDEYAELLNAGPAYTVLVDDKVVCCAGILQVSKFRWNVWALLSKDSGKHMLGITRAVKKFLDENSKTRYETHVRSDFVNGHKWMKMLEFSNETPNGMKAYGDDGYDYCLYARVK